MGLFSTAVSCLADKRGCVVRRYGGRMEEFCRSFFPASGVAVDRRTMSGLESTEQPRCVAGLLLMAMAET